MADDGDIKLFANVTSSYLSGNHMGITKYGTKSDPNFQIVSERLKNMVRYFSLSYHAKLLGCAHCKAILMPFSSGLVTWRMKLTSLGWLTRKN